MQIHVYMKDFIIHYTMVFNGSLFYFIVLLVWLVITKQIKNIQNKNVDNKF
jgi:hypothetical protein